MKKTQSKSYNAAAVLWLEHHIDSFKSSFQRNLANPLSFMFTVCMVAIALSIPISLYILFTSAQQLTQQWDSYKQITLFLIKSISLSEAKKIAGEIDSYEFILRTNVIDKQKALQEFNSQMGLSGITNDLTENPLPHIIIVEPESTAVDITTLKNLQDKLTEINQVEQVQFDLLWFQRLQSILSVIHRIQWIVSIILIFAIALIIANVIRWEVSARHSEIEIIKLVGASDTYVRRPFLYSGFWLGFCGALLALIIVAISNWLIQLNTTQLALLFDSNFKITSLSVGSVSLITIFMSILGVAASWLAVTHKLKQYS